ncbi:MAG: hypothetical protein E7536_03820 [Ruminococcaceae bacterium]|nr:hypothetical protein [Oscillospiraceae bacterium]
MKKFIAIVMVVVSLFSVMSISVFATEEREDTIIVTVNETEFIFDADTTEEFRNKAIAAYFNESDEDVATYGLICTLFGHKLESKVITAITHKKRATDPRCLRETYEMQACSRCDYITKSLISSSYISCCA